MLETIKKFEEHLVIVKEKISNHSDLELSQKIRPEKWSKKEIIGHLVDSGIYNLQRIAEIQFEKKPFRINAYDHVELVKVNDYQNAKSEEIIAFLLSINIQIKNLIIRQTSQSLDYKIEYGKGTIYDDGTTYDLRFLINDYVKHFEHHINQIIKT